MDILAHGLWAAAAAKTCNQVYGRIAIRPYKLNAVSTAFWGVFPDLFAFTISFAWLILGPLFGDHIPRMGPPEEGEPPPNLDHWAFRLASLLYNYSHSLVIFSIISLFLWGYRHNCISITSLVVRCKKRLGGRADTVADSWSEERVRESSGNLDAGGIDRVFSNGRQKNKKWRTFPYELLGWPLHILIDIPTHSYEFYPTPFLWPISKFKIDGLPWSTPWFFIATYTGLVASSLTLWFISRRQKKIRAVQEP